MRARLAILVGVLGVLASTWWLWAPGRGQLSLGPARLRTRADLTVVVASMFRGSLEVGQVIAVYADLEKWRPIILPNPNEEPLAVLAPSAPVVVNGSFFTPEGAATGLLVSRGERLKGWVSHGGPAGSGVLTVDKAVTLHQRERFTTDLATDFAIQAGPRVIEPGGEPGIRSDDGSRANRTVIGRANDGRLGLVVVHAPEGGHGNGPTLFELQRLLGPEGLGAIRDELGFDSALNLDGGTSTGARVSWGPNEQLTLPSRVSVPNAIALELRS